jgi:hypothetical protein
MGLRVRGMRVDSGASWFRVESEGTLQTISREELLNRNFLALIEFYEEGLFFKEDPRD